MEDRRGGIIPKKTAITGCFSLLYFALDLRVWMVWPEKAQRIGNCLFVCLSVREWFVCICMAMAWHGIP